MKKVINKILIIFSAFFVFFSSAPPANALIDYPSPTEAMDQIIGNLGVNKTELKYLIQTMNVQRRKKQQPQVSLTFSPANPTNGQKVTAVATPTYFLNTDKSLYFTWYLKSDACDEKSSGLSSDEKKKCDLDNDDDIDVNDYKIKAARIIANNGFEWDKDGAYSNHNDSDEYKAVWGGNDQQGKNNFCYIHDIESGDEYEIECNNHLFAEMSDSHHDTGDGSFDMTEEKFWRTNPNDHDTADTGNGDEANVAGLGINNFSWNYEEGDEIGVVVEGISIEATQEADSSYRIMFALLNNTCELDYENKYPVTKTISDTTTTNYDEMDGTTPVSTTRIIVTTTEVLNERAAFYAKTTTTTTTRTIVSDMSGNVISDNSTSSTASPVYKNIDSSYYPDNIKKVTDLDKCLPENMISPMEGGGIREKMDINLTYSPEFPMNDSFEGDGDILIVNSSVTNASSENYLNYYWQVYANDEINPDSWGNPLAKSELIGSSQTQGIGVKSLSFKLNFKEPKKYLRVKLTVKENAEKNTVREGSSDIIIPLSSVTEKMKIFNTGVTFTATGTPIVTMGENEMCASGLDKSICPIVKHQIIGLSGPKGMSDFSWSVNGEQLNYTKCFFEGCNSEKQSSTAFFPVLGNIGTQYEVSLTANNLSTGEKINLTRYFEVMDPSVEISSADEDAAQPVLLGHYIDYNGKEWPDWSNNTFQAVAGKKMKFAANFFGFIPRSENYGWVVDGLGINIHNAASFGYEINDKNELIVPAGKAGDMGSIGVVASYFPDNPTKKALNAYWDVNYGSFYETQVGDSVDVYYVNSIEKRDIAGANNGKNKIFAALFSSTPSYLAFLFRITLTGMLLIFFSGFISSFLLRTKQN